jgi:hypothetical protein
MTIDKRGSLREDYSKPGILGQSQNRGLSEYMLRAWTINLLMGKKKKKKETAFKRVLEIVRS